MIAVDWSGEEPLELSCRVSREGPEPNAKCSRFDLPYGFAWLCVAECLCLCHILPDADTSCLVGLSTEYPHQRCIIQVLRGSEFFFLVFLQKIQGLVILGKSGQGTEFTVYLYRCCDIPTQTRCI